MQQLNEERHIITDLTIFDVQRPEMIRKHERDGYDNIDRMAASLMISTGIRPNLKGYIFLVKVVSCCVKDPKLLFPLNSGAYKAVSDRYGSSVCCVERNIRTAINSAYDTSPEQLRRYFAYPGEKPYVSEFIAVAVDVIRQEILKRELTM